MLPVDNPNHPYYTPNLSTCVETVPRLTGCEAAYFFPMGVDVCLSDGTANGDVVHEQRGNGASGRSGSGVKKNPVGSEEEEGRPANTLVIHVRSGDIFVDPVVPGYGQVSAGYLVLLRCTVRAFVRAKSGGDFFHDASGFPQRQGSPGLLQQAPVECRHGYHGARETTTFASNTVGPDFCLAGEKHTHIHVLHIFKCVDTAQEASMLELTADISLEGSLAGLVASFFSLSPHLSVS